ncbi:hypothetical protein BJX99DRAFT_263959 [Aspergillus californicus]
MRPQGRPVEGTKQLATMLAGKKHESWDLAFPTAEGMYGAGRDAQMVLEHFGIPASPFAIFHPGTCPDSSDDLRSTIRDVLAKSRHAESMKFSLFIKPACEGSSKGIYSSSKVRSMAELEMEYASYNADTREYPHQGLPRGPRILGQYTWDTNIS